MAAMIELGNKLRYPARAYGGRRYAFPPHELSNIRSIVLHHYLGALKMNYKRLLAFIFVMLTPMMANAVQIQITNFQLWPAIDSDDTIRIVTPGIAHQNPAGCTDPDSYIVPSTYSAPVRARIFATLLTAVALKKPVTIEIGAMCILNRPSVTRVIIQ